jgi:CHRD domain/HYR domain
MKNYNKTIIAFYNLIPQTMKSNFTFLNYKTALLAWLFLVVTLVSSFQLEAQVCGGSPSYAPTTVGSISGTGTVNIEIGGTGAGNYDQMIISGGTAGDNDNTGQTLNVCFASGYTPANGDVIKIWDANVAFTGAFASMTSLGIGWSYVNDGTDLSVKYCTPHNAGTLSGTSGICIGNMIPLMTSGDAGGTWSVTAGTGTASITSGGVLEGLTAGTVFVNYIFPAANGCPEVAATPLAVTVNPLPSPSIAIAETSGTANDGNVCGGTMVTLTASGGTSHNWSGGITNGMAFTPLSTTNYIVTVTDANSCSATASQTINVNEVLPGSIAANTGGSQSPGCHDYDPLVTTSTGATSPSGGTITYRWEESVDAGAYTTISGATGATYNVPNLVAPSVMVTYHFRRIAISTQGSQVCEATSNVIDFIVNPLPIVANITGGTNVCVGGTNQLSNATSGGVWSIVSNSFASIDGSGLVSGLAVGSLNSPNAVRYTVTDGNGCQTTRNRSVDVIPAHSIALTSANATQTVCKFTPIDPIIYTLSGGATNATVTGLPSGVTASVSSNILTISGTPTTPPSGATGGSYPFTISTTGNACVAASASGTITVKTVPNGTISSSGTAVICAGQDASSNVVLVGTPDFMGTINVAVQSGIGTASTLSYTSIVAGSSAITIPSANLPNTSASNTIYRLTLSTLSDASGCSSIPTLLTGFLDITVNPLPNFSVTTGPVSSAISMICPGTPMSFSTDEPNDVSAPATGKYNWVAKDFTGATLGSGANVVNGTNSLVTTLGLSCPTTHTNPITFIFTPIGPASLNCAGLPVTYEVWVGDNTAPVVMTPNGSSTVECIAAATAPTMVPTGSDNCAMGPISGSLTSTVDTPSSITCEGTRVYTYTYTDACNNTASWTYTYTIEKTPFTDPTDAGSTVACAALAITPSLPTVVDNCGNTLTPAATTMGGTYVDCEGTITYTYVYTDCEGNTQDWVYTYTIEVLPFTDPTDAGSTVACAALAVTPTLPTVMSNCGATLTPGPVSMGGTYVDCEGTITYTYVYTDCEGNTQDWVYTYTIEVLPFVDPTDAGSTVACAALAVTPTLPTVMSNCGATLTPGPVSMGGTYVDCEGTITYTYVYTDCEGNTQDWVYTYTIEVLPFANPTDAGSTVECAAMAIAPTPPMVTSNCGAALMPSAPIMGGTYVDCEGTITYTYLYTDCEGNTQDWVYTYTIDHVTPPVVPADGSSIVACFADAVEPTPPTVTDVCGTAITPVLVSGPNTVSLPTCEGTKTYTFTYTDCSGLISTWNYVYTIEREDFIITTPTGSSTVACVGDAIAANVTLPTVLSDCGETLTGVLQPVGGTYDGCEGTKVYTWTFTDCEGNSHDYVYTYTIEILDFTIANPTGSSTVSCIADATAAAVILPTVTSNCGLTLTPSAPATSGTYDGCEGTRIYTWTYTDCELNSHDFVYTYTIERDDFTIPSVTNSSTVSCIADATAAGVILPTVMSDCGETLTPSAPVTIGTYAGCEGTRVYTWTYTDCELNSHDFVYTYTIDMTVSPVVPLDGGSTIACLADATTRVSGMLLGAQENPPVATPANGVVSGTFDPLASTLAIEVRFNGLTAPASAAHIHTAPAGTNGPVMIGFAGFPTTTSGTYTNTYPLTPPQVAMLMSGNLYVNIHSAAFPGGEIRAQLMASVGEPTPPILADQCGRPLVASPGVASSDPACEGDKTWTFTYTDCSGLSSTWNYIYTIERLDFTMPMNEGSTIECASSLVAPMLPVVKDNCGNTLTPAAPVISNTPACEGSVTYTYTYTDCEMNSHDWVYTYAIDHTTAPTEVGGPVATTSTVSCFTLATAPATLPVIKDVCGNTIPAPIPVITGSATSAASCSGDVIYTYTYEDCSGLTKTWVYTYTIFDNVAPIATTSPLPNLNVGAGVNCTVPMPDLRSYVNVTECNPNYIIEQILPQAIGSDVIGYGGTLTIVFRVTDDCGNSSTTSGTLQLVDTTAPTAICQPATVVLNSSGIGTLTTAMVNNGSFDNCSAVTLSLSQTTFDCDDISPLINGIQSNKSAKVAASDPGTITVVLTVTDVAGNSSTCTAQVTVVDNVPPVALCKPATVQLDAMGVGTLTAADINNMSTDACGIASLSASKTTFDCTNVGANTVILTVTDVNGNTATCNATVTVQDMVAPVAICQNVTVTLDAMGIGTTSAEAVDNGSNDACGIAVIGGLALSKTSFDCTNLGTNSVILTVTDVNGNTATCSATVIVVDATAPVAICQNVTVSLDAMGNGSTTAALVNNGSTDACGIVSMSLSQSTFTCANIGSNSVILTVTDASGNSSTCTANVTVQDLIAPVAICQNVTVTLDAMGNGTTTAAAVNNGSSDACGILSLSLSKTAFTCADVAGPNIVILTVTDVNGNSSTCSASVTVVDNTAPIAVCQAVTVTLDGTGNGSTTAALVNNGSSDACGIASLALSQSTFTCANLGANTVTLTVTDVNGNSSTCSATVTVIDNIAPIITTCAPAMPIIVNKGPNCTNELGDYRYLVMATDNCTGLTIANISQSPALNTSIGASITSQLITFTVTDGSGNTSTCSTTILFKDLEVPVITNGPANISVNTGATCGQVASWDPIIATDNCAPNGPNMNIGPVTVTSTHASGSTFPVGVTTVTITATDASMNTSTHTFTVTVVDVTLPMISCSGLEAEINNSDAPGICGAVYTYTAPVGTDNCSGATTIQTSGLPSGSTFPIGTTINTFKVTDAAGNTATCSFIVTVYDDVMPAISCPANISVNNDLGVCGAVVTFTAPVGTDNCSGAITEQIGGPASGSTFPIGMTTVTYKVTDVSGNSATCAFTVTVTDNEKPIIADCPANIELSTGVGSETCGTIATWTAPTATDNCPPNLSLTYVTSPTAGLMHGAEFPVGVTTVTYTAVDGYGNSSTCSFTITVEDNTAPVVMGCPDPDADLMDNITTNGDDETVITVSTGVGATTCNVVYTLPVFTVTDNCAVTSTAHILTITDSFGNSETYSGMANFPTTFTATKGENQVGYIFIDAAGNETACSFLVVVNDGTVPVADATSLSDVIAQCTVTSLTPPTATDNCSGTLTGVSDAMLPITTQGTTIVTWTFTDLAGNTSQQTQNVVIEDTTDPMITCPTDITNIPTNAAGCTATLASVGLIAPVATDNCAGTPTVTNDAPANFPVGTTTVTWTATDAVGNTASCTQNVTVVNTLVANDMLADVTVAQNIATTSTVTFGASGGTKPYTFTYSVNNGVTTTTATITTSAMNDVVTVPQSNAVPGTFTYTLLSITDANGCSGMLPADPIQVITIVTGNVDLFPTIPRPLSASLTVSQTKEGYVQITNSGTTPTVGTVTFRISKPANFTLTIPPMMVTSAGATVNNGAWTINGSHPLYYSVSSVGPINNASNIKIGYTLTATGAVGSNGTITTTVLTGTGGDTNTGNNQTVKTFVIN